VKCRRLKGLGKERNSRPIAKLRLFEVIKKKKGKLKRLRALRITGGFKTRPKLVKPSSIEIPTVKTLASVLHHQLGTVKEEKADGKTIAFNGERAGGKAQKRIEMRRIITGWRNQG